MRTNIPYETALQRHPESVKEIMGKLQKGKSKEKNSKPEELEWHYDWCVALTRGCYTGDQFLQIITGQRQPDPEPETVEEHIKEFEVNCHAHLAASKGHWFGDSRERVQPIPPEILEPQRKRYEEDHQEKERIAKLTPEQKNAEVEALLNQLRGTRGFIEIRR